MTDGPRNRPNSASPWAWLHAGRGAAIIHPPEFSDAQAQRARPSSSRIGALNFPELRFHPGRPVNWPELRRVPRAELLRLASPHSLDALGILPYPRSMR